MSPPFRWRVECRKRRGPWRTVQTEPYALLCEAQTARLCHLLTEDWDSVEVVEVVGEQGDRRRLLVAGARMRCPWAER